MKIASFDIDAQKTFTYLCPDELPVPEGHLIVDELNANAQLADFRVACREGHTKGAVHETMSDCEMLAPVVGYPNVDMKWKRHGVAGTFGFELLDGLPHPIEGYDFMVTKGIDHDCHPYGGVYHDAAWKKTTGLIEFLKCNNVTYVLCGGLALDYCVKISALQLRQAGFQVILNLAATRGISEQTSNDAIKEMMDAGVVIVKNAEEAKRIIEE